MLNGLRIVLYSSFLLNIIVYCTDIIFFQDGATALFKACHKGHVEIVEELLNYKPNLSLLPVSLFVNNNVDCLLISVTIHHYILVLIETFCSIEKNSMRHTILT